MPFLLNTATMSPASSPKLQCPLPRTKSPRLGTVQRRRCQAYSSNTSSSGSDEKRRRSSWVMEYDLYELLGVERSAAQAEIKAAYRALQKRCHPDVAGAAGHDMAILLNEVYALLSDPAARLAYDQEQAKQLEFRGYTARPLYSSWFGSEDEERAVFVDEVKCIGCLKCALLANKTFAIESVYGRARVVAQWADPEDKILDAIQTCPVDCISMVERSNLAALEFLMSKQPRGNVRISEGNSTGARVSNIFAEVDKFQSRFREMKEKSAKKESKESDRFRESRNSAVQKIMSISNWWYWRPSRTPATNVLASLHLPSPPRTSDPLTERLLEAAARRKEEGAARMRTSSMCRDDYWTPLLNLPSSSFESTAAASPPKARRSVAPHERKATVGETKRISIDLTAPLVMALLSAAIVGSSRMEMAETTVIQDHIGGAAALGVVNSFELRVLLAGITWFIIGTVVAGLVQVLGRSTNQKI